MSICSIASRAPSRTAPASSPGLAGDREHGAVVIGSEWMSRRRAPNASRDRVDRVRVPPLGDVRDREQRRHEAPSSTQRPRSSTGSTVDLEARLDDDDVEVNRDRDGAADACARAEGDVDRPEDLLVLEHVAGQRGPVVGADAELGEVACRARREPGSSSRNSGPRPPWASTIRPPLDRQRGRLGGSGRGAPGSRRRSVPSPLERRDERLAARQVSEPRPALRRSPSSGMPWRPVRSSVEVRAARAASTRASSAPSSSAATARERAAIVSKSTAITRASMSVVTPGIVAPRAPVVGRPLARRRVAERPRRRAR